MNDTDLDDLYSQLMSERFGELWKPKDMVDIKDE